MEQGLWGAVIAALITSVILGGIDVLLQHRNQKHAIKMQQDQWDKEAAWRREDERNAMGLQIHAQAAARTDQKNEWARQREDRNEQREFDRQREYDRDQVEAMRALEIGLVSFSRAARSLFEAKQDRYKLEKAGKALPVVDEELQSAINQFNDLRYVVLGWVAKIDNEKLRRRAVHLYELDEAMAFSEPFVWHPDGKSFGGYDPIMLQVTWQEQMIRILGRLYRKSSIDHEFVEEHPHAPDPRRSAAPVID